MAGLLFFKFGFKCFSLQIQITTYFLFLIKSGLVKLETSCTMILPPTARALWKGSSLLRRNSLLAASGRVANSLLSQELKLCFSDT